MNRLKRLQTNQPKIGPGHWLLFFSLLGFGLRLQQLSFQPLWGDEGWSFYFAMQPLPQLLALTAIDIHPPLYYILLKDWLLAAGTGPEEARFFSVVVGTTLIPVVGILGWRLFEGRVGATAAAVVSVMPLAVYYSQEVRMYGLVTLLGAMSVYFLLRVRGNGESANGESANPQGRCGEYLKGTLWVNLQNRCGESTGQKGYVDGSFDPKMAKRRNWYIAYVLTTTAALYTMYYAAFVPLFQLLYTLLFPVRQLGRWQPRAIFARLAPFIWVGLLYLPWLVYAGPRLVSYVQNKRVVEGYVPLNFIRFFGDHFVAFSLGHVPPELQSYVWTALPFVLVALLGFIATRHLNGQRYLYLYLYLCLPLFMGYLINQVYPFTPRYFERTLLLVGPAYWLLIAAGVIWLWDRQYLLVGTVVMAMLLVTVVSLLSFYSLPRYPDEDYRPLLKDIAARATPQDTVLASYQWQLGFYQAYLPSPHPQLFTVPGWGRAWAGQAGQARRVQDLTGIFDRSPRLWFPAHQAQGHLWEDEAEATIAAVGYPALLQWHGPQTKLTLAGASPPSLQPAPTANFADRLILLQASLGNVPYQAGRDIVPIALTWQKQDNLGSEHRVNLRLADAEGRTWASRDSYPRAGQAFFTDLTVGDTLSDRHGLLIPAGTPPGLYRLLLSVRRVSDAHPLDLLDAQGQPLGAELLLGEVAVIAPNPPVGPAALPVQFSTEAIFGRSVRLVGYSLDQGPFKAGQALPLTLFWQSLTDHPDFLTVFVQLQEKTGQPVVGYERPPLWPSSEWQRRTLLRDPYDLPLPPTLPPGEYRLVIGLTAPDQTRLSVAGSDQLPLTQVTTVDRPHTFAAPEPQIPLSVVLGDQAKLVGLDLPQTQVKAGEHLPLTLYWQAITTFDKNWTVFVHLLNHQGQIVSQQDQIPGGGQFPTTSWLPDEYLVDTYNLLIPADTLPGHDAYWLEIGLYDANDFSRLPVIEAGEIIDDHIVLDRWSISIE